jgi:hypothetical protein
VVAVRQELEPQWVVAVLALAEMVHIQLLQQQDKQIKVEAVAVRIQQVLQAVQVVVELSFFQSQLRHTLVQPQEALQ